MGKIEVKTGHILLNKSATFGISSLMQQHLCFMGQMQVFEEASESFCRITGVKVSVSQIQRVCHYYGQILEEEQQKAITGGGKDKKVIHKARCYAMLDGGMLLTREEKWKEMKLARLFNDSDAINISQERGYIGGSTYVAHLGNHKAFLKKVEYHVDTMADVIFVADGAKWIWKWVETMYPESTQILDFFHAKEHLCQWAGVAMKDENEKQNWIDEQSLLLLNNKVEVVMNNIAQFKVYTPKARTQRKILLSYYATHRHRMNYKTYKENHLMIGSGPIEAAHRHVIQQRMKLSGQRWTIKGAQQIANLRTAYRSNKWVDIVELVKKVA
jgi:hypothetical protein